MLLYVIESAVPFLTILLVWAASLALKKDIEKHKKVALGYAVATLVSYALVIILVRFGYKIGGETPKWLMNLHLVVIYTIPLLLVGLVALGLKGRRKAHIVMACIYAIYWSGALITGAMIFISAKDRF